ncbi:TRAP transporter large permease subunit [Shewanella schlegeliana]|uniref:TRAP transporter large permease protein n=1 Tax=Shewanella schlegeliana TaxID=190308 RepID=A0ABS1T0E2_9GAMM|nr:TRAP transporter large permease subunit [Shewanella schlegeliana]MBL4913639.1 TRAP transporter large permease subunit [Shewanella schlegeliana]MCL1108530.1 TRAP transporter large permease subunit [Shewanella schlegeliana]GIU30916.1 C4-dicarboxylate ABC transporter [Shewanella schlegeliana]
MAILLFVTVCLVLMLGYPVALTLAGVALMFAGIGQFIGLFDATLLGALPNRLFGIINNSILMAVPLFVFMGVVLEKSKVAEQLLISMAELFGRFRGGLIFSVFFVGMLLAASTGIVGATVVTMGLMSLPTLLKRGYDPAFSAGAICATGTLGQIIPPSIALVLLGDVLSNAYQQAQLEMGIFSPKSVSVGDLFAGAIVPGLLLLGMYCLYTLILIKLKPDSFPKPTQIQPVNLSFILRILNALIPPLVLIFLVLGSILFGVATPTEAASVGAFGALVIAMSKKQLQLAVLKEVMISTVKVTSMVFLILIGASIFSLVFRGLGGEELIHQLFTNMPGGVIGATLLVMLVIFLLGFILDFIEITFVVVPLVAPILLAMGLDPIWLGIMIAVNLQTSFLTPPFGFALFYLRGVTKELLSSAQIYRGVLPFVLMQLLLLLLLSIWPALITWLPAQIYG